MQIKFFFKLSFIFSTCLLLTNCSSNSNTKSTTLDSSGCQTGYVLNTTSKTCVDASLVTSNCMSVYNADGHNNICQICNSGYTLNIAAAGNTCIASNNSNCLIQATLLDKLQCLDCADGYSPDLTNPTQCNKCDTSSGMNYIKGTQACWPTCTAKFSANSQYDSTLPCSVDQCMISTMTESQCSDAVSDGCHLVGPCYSKDASAPAASYYNYSVCTNCNSGCADTGNVKTFCDSFDNLPDVCKLSTVSCQYGGLNPYCVDTTKPTNSKGEYPCVPGCAPSEICPAPTITQACSSDNNNKSGCPAGFDNCHAFAGIQSGDTSICKKSLAPPCLQDASDSTSQSYSYYTKELCTTCFPSTPPAEPIEISPDIFEFCSNYDTQLCLGADVGSKYAEKSGGIACAAASGTGTFQCKYYTNENNEAILYDDNIVGCNAEVLEKYLDICAVVALQRDEATCSSKTNQSRKPNSCSQFSGTTIDMICGGADGPYYCGACRSGYSLDACTGTCITAPIENCYMADENGCIACNSGYQLGKNTTCVECELPNVLNSDNVCGPNVS